MGFQQYHEPPNELSEQTRTFARMIASLIEEADAINWYEQRLSIEKDQDAKAIMTDAQGEEFKHFGMDLEFLLEGVSATVEGWCGGGGRFVRIDSPKRTLMKGHHRREKTVSYRQSGRENRQCEHRAVRKG